MDTLTPYTIKRLANAAKTFKKMYNQYPIAGIGEQGVHITHGAILALMKQPKGPAYTVQASHIKEYPIEVRITFHEVLFYAIMTFGDLHSAGFGRCVPTPLRIDYGRFLVAEGFKK